jgi:hypothetical protein
MQDGINALSVLKRRRGVNRGPEKSTGTIVMTLKRGVRVKHVRTGFLMFILEYEVWLMEDISGDDQGHTSYRAQNPITNTRSALSYLHLAGRRGSRHSSLKYTGLPEGLTL